MNKKVAIIAGIAVIGLVGAFALKGNGKKDEAKANVAATSTVKVTHKLGTTEVPKNPKKVVVFDVPTLDTMEALGVDNVVGVPKSTYPDSLKKYNTDKYTKLGSLKEPDLEGIKSAKPDLIIIEGRQGKFYDQLKEIAPTISMSKDTKKYYDEAKKNINTLAEIFGKEDVAKKKLDTIDKKVNEVKGKVKGAKSLVVMANEGKLSVYGDGSRFSLLHQGFGFTNADEKIDEATHGQNVTHEYLAKINPEYIIVHDRGVAIGNEATSSTALDNDIVKSMDAYKNGKIINLDSYTWYINDAGLNSLNIMINDIDSAIK